ncbi:MAG: hypothetical protein BWY82_02781 [Verrucomicrobia bacterium ADurb.Bin474]|nr:MAG: hypothetical protein BWY82_02781 [Verrucomicrobia bacterium ADurb.Bin474]
MLIVIRGKAKTITPIEAQPADVFLDHLDIVHVLLGRIRVVHAQVAQTAIFPGHSEIEAYCLRVANVQIPVRLRWETGMDPVKPLFSKVTVNRLLDEMTGFFCRPTVGFFHNVVFHI